MILTIYENRVESNQDTAWTIVWVKQDKKFIEGCIWDISWYYGGLKFNINKILSPV